MPTQTKTLLDGVNDAAMLGRVIQGEQERFTSLTSGSHQVEIDNLVVAINQVITYIYDNKALQPQGEKEGTFVLVDGQRAYDFPVDYEAMVSCILLDQTNGYQIFEHEPGYEHLVNSQLQANSYIGRPYLWTINPSTNQLYLDRIPGASEAGQTYRYMYRKTLTMTDAADTFPFSDEVYRDLIPAFMQYWRSDAKDQFNEAFFTSAISRAVDKIRGTPMRIKR